MLEETRVLNSKIALLAIKLAYRELQSKLADAERAGVRELYIWGPEEAVTIVASWDRTWQCVHAPEGLREWLRSEAGQAWLESKGFPLNSGPEVFESVARNKLARLEETGMDTSKDAVLEGAAFLEVGDCLYSGAVRFPGFDVSTSGFTGETDEDLSLWVGDYALTMCRQIANGLRAMEHEGVITQEMLDEARAEVLARWKQLLPEESAEK